MRFGMHLVVGAAVAVTGVARSGPAAAHETWAALSTAAGKVRVSLETSSRFPAGESAVAPERIESNMLMAPSELTEVKGWKKRGTGLGGEVAASAPAHHLFQFVLKPKLITLDAKKFDAYLAETGLEAARRERQRRKEQGAAGRERYVKSGKALITLGEVDGEPALAGAGLVFDLVPTSDPRHWDDGEVVEVQALYRGEPAIARQVTLACAAPGGRAARKTAVTDARGVVRLEVPPGPRCMLSSVDMRRLEGDPAADWESTWHTFTFERVRTP